MENKKSIEDLSKDISNLLSVLVEQSKTDKEEISKEIDSMKKEKEVLQKETDSLKQEVDSLKNVLSEKEAQIKRFEEERIQLLKQIMEG